MAKFRYIGKDKDGRDVNDVVDAKSEAVARIALTGQGIRVAKIVEMTAADGPKKTRKPLIGTGVKAADITVFSRQIATLLKAGLPLLRSLEVISRQEKNPYFRTVIEQVADNVRTGNKFSDGLAQHPKIFDNLYVNMARAGEAGGVLDVVLDRIATFQEKAQKIKGKIKGAMVYPMVIMSVAVVIVVLLMVVVVPKFQKVFSDTLKGSSMPAITEFVIGISDFIRGNIIATLVIIAAAVIGSKLFFKTKFGARAWDMALLKLPAIGNLTMKSTVSRFARTFGTLLASGVPILEALTITKGTLNSVVVKDALQRVHDRVRDGENLAGPLENQKLFPSMVTSMVEVGEETGQLSEMLNRIADNYDEEVDNAVGAVTSIIEPIMIVMMAVVVGVIVIALFMPLIQIISTLNG